MSSALRILLLGDARVGKSTFITRWQTGEFTSEYTKTAATTMSTFNCNTNYGPITLHVYDIPSAVDDLPEADGIIGMFDLTSAGTYDVVTGALDGIAAGASGKLPTVLCGNKADVKGRVVKAANIKSKFQYYDISAKSKSNYNFEQPFLFLARKFTGHDDLVFLCDPVSESDPVPQCRLNIIE